MLCIISFKGEGAQRKTNLLALVLLSSALGASLLLRLALLQESLGNENIVLDGDSPARSD